MPMPAPPASAAQGLDQNANVAKSSWLRAAEPDFATEWAVLGSNQ